MVEDDGTGCCRDAGGGRPGQVVTEGGWRGEVWAWSVWWRGGLGWR
ncbi:hypothetical protein ABZ487_31975 [Micromonospora aurantiaca]